MNISLLDCDLDDRLKGLEVGEVGFIRIDEFAVDDR
jgi:hypothetical protein